MAAASFTMALAVVGGTQETPRRYVTGLDFPVNMAFAPDGRLLVAEKESGRVRLIEDGELREEPFATIDVESGGEAGLLGIAVHPRFEEEPWVYVYASRGSHNEIVRWRADGDTATDEETVFRALDVTSFHNGGDITFGPDDALYVVTGDGQDGSNSQDPDSPGGKVLRINPDGSTPSDNPLGADNPAYTLGHRNSFGICVDPESGTLWQTENGPERLDEINRLEPGANYGWPDVLGPAGDERFQDPALAFQEVIVPTGCAFLPGDALGARSGGALFFGDYRGRLHRALLSEDRTEITSHRVFAEDLGGITDVQAGPDGRLYIAAGGGIYRMPGSLPEPEEQDTEEEDAASPAPDPPAPEPEGGSPILPWVVGVGVLLLLLGLIAARLRR